MPLVMDKRQEYNETIVVKMFACIQSEMTFSRLDRVGNCSSWATVPDSDWQDVISCWCCGIKTKCVVIFASHDINVQLNYILSQ